MVQEKPIDEFQNLQWFGGDDRFWPRGANQFGLRPRIYHEYVHDVRVKPLVQTQRCFGPSIKSEINYKRRQKKRLYFWPRLPAKMQGFDRCVYSLIKFPQSLRF